MPGPYPLATLAPTIDASGITAPPFSDIIASMQQSYRNIFGQDINLDPSTQDGGWIAFMSSMQNDVNAQIINTYLSYSPTYAQGNGLSSLVKINGLRRKTPTTSSVPVALIGVAGTPINSGIIEDDLGNEWLLPVSVTIPNTGTITVTATCAVVGAIIPDSFTIVSVQKNWQEVNIAGSVTPGLPVELDPELKQRQSISTSLPAQTPKQAIQAQVANINGIGRYAIYENDTSVTDSNGLPRNSISIVAEGGDVILIATAISEKKAPGSGTYGTTSEMIVDPAGVPNMIKFFEMTEVQVFFLINIKALPGYVSSTGSMIQAAVALDLGSLKIGEDSDQDHIWSTAKLRGDAAIISTGLPQSTLDMLADTYRINSVYQARNEMRATAPVASAGATVNVTNVANYAVGKLIAIQLHSGGILFAAVTSIVGNVVGFAPAVPGGGESIDVGALVYVAGDVHILFNEGAECAPVNGQYFVT